MTVIYTAVVISRGVKSKSKFAKIIHDENLESLEGKTAH